MAESMKGLHRTHRCAETVNAAIGSEVTVMGWVSKSRNKGGIVFTDLRDRSGILQIIFEEDTIGSEGFEKAGRLRSEFVIAVTGTVQNRAGAENPNLATGKIEVVAKALRILSESEVPPFPVEDGIKTKEDIRLKYRFLDLRRPEIQKNIMLRSKVTTSIRAFMANEGFLEIETPMLCKSTPEGARDYLVPSRIHPGNFYALPQSPQLFKQLLMVSGYDRYFQIAKCFRDEDLRADRQPEFTQVDMELSFVDIDDVIDVNERLLKDMFKKAIDVDVQLPIQRMTWQDAMNRFGSDKPDLRYGMEMVDLDEVAKACDFVVFKGAVEAGGAVRAINVKGLGGLARKKIDALTDFVKGYGLKGLAYISIPKDGEEKCSFAKFMKPEEIEAIKTATAAEAGDLILIVASEKWNLTVTTLGALRCHVADTYGIYDEAKGDFDFSFRDDYRFVWITEFPLLEWSEEENRYVAMHHPFTMPMDEDLDKIESDPGAVRAKAYDIVLNGVEIGGGSVRIHQDDIQELMFKTIGMSKEEAEDKFGFLLTAFKYGVPPHAGLAYGLDRLLMLMTKADTIRDVMAFPKVKDASDLMCQAPNVVDPKQLDELFLSIEPTDEEGQDGDVHMDDAF